MGARPYKRCFLTLSFDRYCPFFPNADRYCPRGSSAPVFVVQGFYSIGRGDNFVTNTADSSDRAATKDTSSFHTRVAQAICEE